MDNPQIGWWILPELLHLPGFSLLSFTNSGGRMMGRDDVDNPVGLTSLSISPRLL
ncbi:hypothetical protein [Dictyobacter alpinus]|uniref:hypothetical protein n=1 Tax=Dictyobacter alpinus TaxID=2014873 RepID=UPI001386FE77|nr:hypothetical protein [Dictyobacter alpinus]